MGADIRQKQPLLTIPSAMDHWRRTKKDQRGYNAREIDGMVEVYQRCPETHLETLKYFYGYNAGPNTRS